MTAKGKTGHASILHENTAAEKLHKVINKLLGVRESEKARLQALRVPDLGDVTSVNMTMLDVSQEKNTVNQWLLRIVHIIFHNVKTGIKFNWQGGLQPNVVPPELSAVFDIRITPHWTLAYMEKLIGDTCAEAGPDVTYKFVQHSNITAKTAVDDSNVWWTLVKGVTDKL